MKDHDCKIAVVIPCYKVSAHILEVVGRIGPDIDKIYIVDDACPEGSGELVKTKFVDPRLKVITHTVNLGVGGAVMTGYKAAVNDGLEVIVKIDGDGQMDPELIPQFVLPIASGKADYTKGNRFFNLEDVKSMPRIRLFGNAALSFMTKLSSGYWQIFDPTNGFTAIHSDVARQLPYEKISKRYFFESDMLFRLNTLRAVVMDIPMRAHYADEKSNLKIRKVVGEFFGKNLRNFWKRIFYNYYLRDMNLGSIELPVGLAMIIFGISFGAISWIKTNVLETVASSGTIMLAALPIIIGLQLVLAFLAQDIASVPKQVIHRNHK